MEVEEPRQSLPEFHTGAELVERGPFVIVDYYASHRILKIRPS